MAGRAELSVLLLLVALARGQLLTNEDSPSLLDRVLQVVWEPSSLIRMWVGLDQLYNIALSWRGVAKTLASLPFSEGRSAEHVRIQEPRSLKYQKPSVASQWDRFNEIYASSSLSPIVRPHRHRMAAGVLPPPSGYAIHPHRGADSNVFEHFTPWTDPVTPTAEERLSSILGLLRTLREAHAGVVEG